VSCFPSPIPTTPSKTENVSVGCCDRRESCRLYCAAYGTDPPLHQRVKPFHPPPLIRHPQMCPHLPAQSPQPVTLARRVAPRRPPSGADPMHHTMLHRRHRRLDPPEIPAGSEPYHHTTLRTPIALEHHCLRARRIKVRPNKTVPPYPLTATPWTPLRPWPRILPPQLHKRLDAQLDEDYQNLVCWVVRLRLTRREGWSPNLGPSLPLTSFQNKKPPYGGLAYSELSSLSVNSL